MYEIMCAVSCAYKYDQSIPFSHQRGTPIYAGNVSTHFQHAAQLMHAMYHLSGCLPHPERLSYAVEDIIAGCYALPFFWLLQDETCFMQCIVRPHTHRTSVLQSIFRCNFFFCSPFHRRVRIDRYNHPTVERAAVRLVPICNWSCFRWQTQVPIIDQMCQVSSFPNKLDTSLMLVLVRPGCGVPIVLAIAQVRSRTRVPSRTPWQAWWPEDICLDSLSVHVASIPLLKS